MINRKNHNSIIFLTTLSVYLGLVLVGGVTPSVFAQAAAAQKFDVKSEIEVKDDLDKNPDEPFQNKESEAISQFADWLETVVKINSEFPTVKFDFSVKVETSGELTNVKSKWRKGSSKLFDLTVTNNEAKNLRNLFPYKHYESKNNSNHFYLTYKDSKSETKSSIKFAVETIDKAKFFADFYNGNLAQLRTNSTNAPLSIVYKNTLATFENNQVFIVTRLARASIDELLADKTAR